MWEYLDFPKFCARLFEKIVYGGEWRSVHDLKRDFRKHMKTVYDVDNALKQLEAEGRIIKQPRNGERGSAAEGYAINEPGISL
jgi:hypothetical protein